MPFLNQQERDRIIEGAIVVAVVAGPLIALFNPPLGLIVAGVSLSVAAGAVVGEQVYQCQKNKPGSSIQYPTSTGGTEIVSREISREI